MAHGGGDAEHGLGERSAGHARRAVLIEVVSLGTRLLRVRHERGGDDVVALLRRRGARCGAAHVDEAVLAAEAVGAAARIVRIGDPVALVEHQLVRVGAVREGLREREHVPCARQRVTAACDRPRPAVERARHVHAGHGAPLRIVDERHRAAGGGGCGCGCGAGEEVTHRRFELAARKKTKPSRERLRRFAHDLALERVEDVARDRGRAIAVALLGRSLWHALVDDTREGLLAARPVAEHGGYPALSLRAVAARAEILVKGLPARGVGRGRSARLVVACGLRSGDEAE